MVKVPGSKPEDAADADDAPKPTPGEIWFAKKMADYDDARKAAARKVVEADAAARSRAARDDAETKRAARRRDVERSAVLKLRNHVDARMTALRVARDERVAARAAAAATAAGDDATATTTTTTESTWVTTKRPVFVSFAAGEDASFHELRFVARFAARIETAGAGALFRIESGHPVPGVTREDKALLRAEAAKDAEAVVFVVTPASLRCERCELERDVVTTRREPVDLGGDGARVPCVALLDAEDVSSESAARPPSVDVPPRLLARDDPPAFRLSLPDRPADGVAPHADPAAAAARFVLRSLVDVGVLSPLDVDVDAIEDVADVVDETKIIAKTRFETKPATAAPLDDRRVKALLDAMGGSWKKRRPLEWSVEEVAAWVSSLGGDVGAASEKFRALGVDGRLLFALNDQTLRQTLGVTLAETRTRTLRSIADLATDRTRALNGDTRTVTFDGGDDDDDAAARLARMNDDELDAFVADLFVAADADRSGALDRREFKTLLKNANLGFSAKERQAVMEECDDDGDGLVSFAEFSRATRGVIRTAAARRRAAIKSRRGGGGRHFGSTFKVTRNTNRRAEASSALLRGVDRATVEGCLRRVFDAADVDGNGWLDRREFARCLRSHDLGFTRKEVNSLLTSVDGDFDGRVQIDEFIPVAFTLLVERLADDAARVEASSNPTALARVLYAKLKSAAKGKDAVPTVVARDALLSLRDDGIGITRTHAALVLAEARVNSGNKTLPWRPFVETAVTSLWSLLDDDLAATRRKVVAAVADGSGVTTLASLDRAALHGALSAAFAAADVDGSGALDVDEAKAALASIGATIKGATVPENAATAMIRALDADGDGVVRYHELVDFFVDVLLHAERERAVCAALESARRRDDARAIGAAAKEAVYLASKRAEADAIAAERASRRDADVTDACEALASMGIAADDAYETAVRTVVKHASEGLGSRLKDKNARAGCYVGELRESGTGRDKSWAVTYVASNASHAFVVGKTLQPGIGATWQILTGPVDDRGSRRGAVLDVEDAARAGAASLRPAEGPRASRPTSAAASGDTGGYEPSQSTTVRVPPPLEPGAYFAAAFDGGGRRGFVAIDTVGVAPPRVTHGPREYSVPILEDDKALVMRVAEALSACMEGAREARERARDEAMVAAREAFDCEEAREARAAARAAARTAAE